MKKETYQAKMAKLLGLTEVFEEVKQKKTNLNITPVVHEKDIQDFRAAQGVLYFLQAPELFSRKTCKHCGEDFLVSRKYVAYCTYTCINKSLEELGIKWKKYENYEALAKEVYEGNEPIWIRNLDKLEHALDILVNGHKPLDLKVTT